MGFKGAQSLPDYKLPGSYACDTGIATEKWTLSNKVFCSTRLNANSGFQLCGLCLRINQNVV